MTTLKELIRLNEQLRAALTAELARSEAERKARQQAKK
jgi:hypothetical protein